MEQLLHLANQIYIQYMNEIMMGLLVCILILMIAALKAVRKNRKQIKQLSERTKELTKAAFSPDRQGAYVRNSRARRTSFGTQADESDENAHTAGGNTGVSKEEEEIFGAVIQEIFP